MNNSENKTETQKYAPKEMCGNGFSIPSEETNIEKYLEDFEIV